jgi:hypothetical protein
VKVASLDGRRGPREQDQNVDRTVRSTRSGKWTTRTRPRSTNQRSGFRYGGLAQVPLRMFLLN